MAISGLIYRKLLIGPFLSSFAQKKNGLA